ncbi:hypothetical protein CK203_110565 [Vitis vinifera]|uniref:Uncharacterized protein n=1 Tax=Vitis vinifera TaxID=29760 RepID=A0A438CPZ9_VITVI|nr:hypothetical protein CK203_110565 [Vitis vinifera]
MLDFFPLSKQISVNLGGEPLVSSQPDSFSASLSLPSPVFSSCKIARCKRLWKWQPFLLFPFHDSVNSASRENDLVVAQKAATEGAEALKLAKEKKEVIRTEVDKLREEGRAAKAKLKEAK